MLEIRRPQQQLQTVCLVILTVIAIGMALFFLRTVLVPFVLAVLFTYCLTPLLEFQCRVLRLSQSAAIVVTAILSLAALVLVGIFIAYSVNRVSASLGEYLVQLNSFTARLANYVNLEPFGIRFEDRAEQILTIPDTAVSALFTAVLSETTLLLSNGATVAIFVLFLLAGRKASTNETPALLREIEQQVRLYIYQMLLMAGSTGTITWLLLTMLGVEFAWIFGVLTFLLNFIPTIGSIIAALLPMPVILLSPTLSPTMKVVAVLVPPTIQFVSGSIVLPKVQGVSFRLHPVVIMLALIFFGMIWGTAGLFLATPITAVLRIVFDKFQPTQWFAALLGGDLSPLFNTVEEVALVEPDETITY